MATLIQINREIRELKSEAHKSNDAYCRLRPLIRKLEIEKQIKEEEEEEEEEQKQKEERQ
jgi:hypothetical protein